MREIRFRGRHVARVTWVYGHLLAPNIIGVVKEVDNGDGRGYHPEIIEFCLVDRESVGQYTGLKDKNGVEIYKGDIVRYKISGSAIVGDVRWSDKSAAFEKRAERSYIIGEDWYYKPVASYLSSTEVIGNICENPELLNV